jgi:serine/threonine protein kinase
MSPRPHRRADRRPGQVGKGRAGARGRARPGDERDAHQLVIDGFSGLVEIGRGAFASVYQAVEAGTDRPVALKVIDIDGTHPRLIETFHAEVRTLATVSSHPNIVTLYRGVATPDGRPVLVLELCRGSYAQRVRDQGPLPAAEVLSVGIKIAGALETAHRAGFLHRDIKPQNVLVTQFGEPALADFGLATLQASASSSDNALRFTTLHAPPEVLEGTGLSPATDVYGLASTLYQLLTGSPPLIAFAGESSAAVILRILHEPVAPVTRIDVPLAFSDLILSALAKEPSRRPATAAAMGDALRELEVAVGLPPTPYLVWGDEPAKASRDPLPPWVAAPGATGDLRARPASDVEDGADVGATAGRADRVTPVKGPGVVAPQTPERRVLLPRLPGPPSVGSPYQGPPPPGLIRDAPPDVPADQSPEPTGDDRARRSPPRRVPPGGPARPRVADMPLPDMPMTRGDSSNTGQATTPSADPLPPPATPPAPFPLPPTPAPATPPAVFPVPPTPAPATPHEVPPASAAPGLSLPVAPGVSAAVAPIPVRPFRPTPGAPRVPSPPPARPTELSAPQAITWAMGHDTPLERTADPTVEADERAGSPTAPEITDDPPGLIARHPSAVMSTLAAATIAIVIVVLLVAGVL